MINVMMFYPPAKPNESITQNTNEQPKSEKQEKEDQNDLDPCEEEDPYSISPEDIYDTLDANGTYNPIIQNRPPAPIPRPEFEPQLEKPSTYISRGLFLFYPTCSL